MNSQILQKIREANRKRDEALSQLVQPARAAANQMKDAGMHAGAAALNEALFRYDAAQEEMMKVMSEDPAATIQALLESMGGPNK